MISVQLEQQDNYQQWLIDTVINLVLQIQKLLLLQCFQSLKKKDTALKSVTVYSFVLFNLI